MSVNESHAVSPDDGFVGTREGFVQEVEDFLTEFGISSSYFGMKAVRNPKLVERLRDGFGCRPATMLKARQFMSAQRKARDAVPATSYFCPTCGSKVDQ
ncbi:hypothetical protein GGQ68_002494 [Sagittula marina]|uniref:Uncharacterized protein n=1 Tax=Sagittula marina TaxID=943940 RepID=A0A7W6DR23_9RHOB|nr:hypothetical protein [Sagittula marina]MBB3986156.1 hypothetical protein [Sagittula marina]